MIPKIAIQGHSIRGKEVIQILESLGGKNDSSFTGADKNLWYFIHSNGNIKNEYQFVLIHAGFKTYTLEEFEKEFPFKIGDKVITNEGCIGVIEKLIPEHISAYCVKINNVNYWCTPSSLRLYKKMKEERNITLTLDKAKEWYKKGGELKEVALQVYSEEELHKTELPETWEEYCTNYPKQQYETYIGVFSTIESYSKVSNRHPIQDKNVCSSEKSAEAHLALIQLEQLRDCYRQGDIPDFTKSISKYCIVKINKRIDVVESSYTSYFLSFTKKEVAEEFLTNFKPLIKIAEDYI